MENDIVTVAGNQYRKAPWSRRILAAIIDATLVPAICVVCGPRFLAITILLASVYMMLGSAIFNGQSAGKRIIGLKVIDSTHGRPCGLMQEFVRHRYLFFSNPIFLLLTAFDASQGLFEKPELYVVLTAPVTTVQREASREMPAKLDLAEMRASLQKKRKEGGE